MSVSLPIRLLAHTTVCRHASFTVRRWVIHNDETMRCELFHNSTNHKVNVATPRLYYFFYINICCFSWRINFFLPPSRCWVVNSYHLTRHNLLTCLCNVPLSPSEYSATGVTVAQEEWSTKQKEGWWFDPDFLCPHIEASLGKPLNPTVFGCINVCEYVEESPVLLIWTKTCCMNVGVNLACSVKALWVEKCCPFLYIFVSNEPVFLVIFQCRMTKSF